MSKPYTPAWPALAVSRLPSGNLLAWDQVGVMICLAPHNIGAGYWRIVGVGVIL